MKKVIIGLIGFLALGSVPMFFVSAQSEEPQQVSQLPSIFVYGERIVKQEGNNIQGQFEVSNESKDTQGNLNYSIYLIDKEEPQEKANEIQPESFSIYDKKSFSIPGTFAPGEKKLIDFTYNAVSNLPVGEYRIRIRVGTAAGWELGWADLSVKLGKEGGFVRIVPVSVKAEDGVLIDGKLDKDGGAGALEGVNIDPEKNIAFNYALSNIGTKEVKGNLLLETYEWTDANRLVATEEGSSVIVKFGKSAKPVIGAFSTKSASTPGSYLVKLSVVDAGKQKVSTVAEYRYVVKGVTGRVVAASIKQVTDSSVTVKAEVVGSADRTSVLDNASVKFYLLKDGNVVAEKQSIAINLGTEGFIEVTQTLALTSPVSGNMALRVELLDKNGKVLNTYGYDLDNLKPQAVNAVQPKMETQTNEKTSSIASIVVAVIVALAAIIASILLFIRSRRNGDKHEVKIMSFVLLFVSVVAGIYAATGIAKAQGQVVPYIYYGSYQGDPSTFEYHGVRIFVNKPVNNSNNTAHSMPVQADIFWQHCNNRPSQAWIYIDYFTAGGHVVPMAEPKDTKPRGQREWWPSPAESDFLAHGIPYIQKFVPSNLPSSRWTKLIDYKTAVCDDCGSSHDTIQQRTYRGNITLPASLDRVTLRWLAFKKHITDWQAWVNAAAYYSWLSFANPTVDLKVNGNDGPVSVAPASSSSSVSVSWTSSNATSCTAAATPAVSGWSGTKALSSSGEAITLNAGQNYVLTMTCTSAGASGTDSVQVNVGNPSPTLSFTADSTSLAYNTATTLRWTATNATSCTPSNGANGWATTSVALTGSKSTGNLTTATLFTLRCVGAAGTTPVEQTITINVSPAPPIGPTVTLKANNNPVSTSISSSTPLILSWTVAGGPATSCTASATPARSSWSGGKDFNAGTHEQNLGAITPGVHTFRIECSGPGGNSISSVRVTSYSPTSGGKIREL